MSHVDLDARRKARESEAQGERHTITLDGATFTLPREMPLAFAYYLQNMDLLKAANVLVGKDNAERFLEANPSDKDLEDIIELYGVGLGESSASPRSSKNAGKKSKPTSAGSTA